MARVSETIPVVYVPGSEDMGPTATAWRDDDGSGAAGAGDDDDDDDDEGGGGARAPGKRALAAYEARFGADYFSFWVGGTRGVVLNSALLADTSLDPARAAAQRAWLAEEIEQVM